VDANEYLWDMYKEHTDQGRHHETQRTGVSTVVLALAGAVVAFLGQHTVRHPWSLAGFIVGLGLFGALFSLKQTERARMHITIAKNFRQQLEIRIATDGREELPPATPRELVAIDAINGIGRHEHRSEWNWKTGRDDRTKKEPKDPLFPLYWFFLALNLIIALLGVMLGVIS